MPVTDHIDNAIRSVTFTPSASVGPFALPWPIYEADSAAELKSDFLIALDAVVQTDYTVSGTFVNGVAVNGAITFGSPITGTLIIYSRRRPRSSVDLGVGIAVTSEELNAIVNSLLASLRDTYDWLTSSEAGNVLPAGTFVPTAGGTMTGFLDLNADPTTALKAATKQYVDAQLTVTTKGDLPTFSTVPVRLPVGANGKRLVADSTQSSGLAYARDIATMQTLTDAASITWDMDLGDDAKVTLTASRTFAAPSNLVEGRYGKLLVIMNASGGWVPVWNALFVFENGIVENPNPAANARTFYDYRVENSVIVIKRSWQVGLTPVRIYKTADETVAASTTFQNDDHLIVPVEANKNYMLEYNILVNTPIAGGLKVQLTGPATPTEVYINAFMANGNTATNLANNGAAAFSTSMVIAQTLGGTFGWLKIQALIKNGANAGSVTLQWAQNAASGSAIFKQGSYVEYQVIN